MLIVSSPPITIKANSFNFLKLFFTFFNPSLTFNGLVRELPNIVPPLDNIPETFFSFKISVLFSIIPCQPCLIPIVSTPIWDPLLTIALIAAFKPGQSPPPVKTPTRFFIVFIFVIFLVFRIFLT